MSLTTSLLFFQAAVGIASTRTPDSATGRWKSATGCYWDENDDGPDQCSPNSGRWKLNGTTCYWDANDSGPNQCDPDAPSPPEPPAPIVVSAPGGTATFTPVESDGDPTTANFIMSFEDERHNRIGAEIAIRTAVAPQDPPNSFRLDRFWVAPVSFWPPTPACDASPQFENEYWLEHSNQATRQATINGLIAAGGSLLPCVGATVGYLLCVDGALYGTMLATLIVDTIQYPPWCFKK